jgi:hypothetical protein
MKDKLRNTGCPEAISLAILGHSTNTVAANYGSGYALEVMREHLERVWEGVIVEWASGGSERTFDQSAANGRNEPNLADAAVCANDRLTGLKK